MTLYTTEPVLGIELPDGSQLFWKASLCEVVDRKADPDSNAELARLATVLHENELHPDYEYTTTSISLDTPLTLGHEPFGTGSELNVHKGRGGFDNFPDYQKAYWMKRKWAIPSERLNRALDSERAELTQLRETINDGLNALLTANEEGRPVAQVYISPLLETLKRGAEWIASHKLKTEF